MNNKTSDKYTSTVLSRFKVAMFITYIVSMLLILPATYFATKHQMYDSANKELSLLVDMVKAVRNVVREDTRPYFLEKEEFFPVVVSSTVMANTVASKFKRDRPNYHINIASDNPLNAKNLPAALEKSVILKFREDKNLKSINQTGIINGAEFLVSSAPSVAKEGCIRCHGKPEDAPKSIVDTYGTTSGFNYEVGSVVGASFVGVPLADLNALVIKRSLIVMLVLSVFFAIILLIIIRIVKKEIIRPLKVITQSAYEVSRGNLDVSSEEIATNRTDELGSLAQSFELLRTSFTIVMNKLNRLK